MREKRVASRCILLTEVAGRLVAIGPYRDDQAARQDLTRVTGAPQVLELKLPPRPPRFGSLTGAPVRGNEGE